jgi:hypothetical protein
MKQPFEPFYQWSFSKLIVRPFLTLARTPSPNHSEIETRIKAFEPLVPNSVDISSFKNVDSPLALFFLSEIKNLNESLTQIRTDLHNALHGWKPAKVFEAFAKREVPEQWADSIGYYCTLTSSKFATALGHRVEFYENWLKNGLTRQAVNVQFVKNVRGLMLSYIYEMAFQRSTTPATELTFQVTDGTVHHDPGLILTDTWLVGANWSTRKQKFIAPTAKTGPFSKFDQLICVLKSTEKAKDEYNCPFYVYLPARSSAKGSEQVVDGAPANFIWNVRLKTRVPPAQLTAGSVAIVCQIPDCCGF